MAKILPYRITDSYGIYPRDLFAEEDCKRGDLPHRVLSRFSLVSAKSPKRPPLQMTLQKYILGQRESISVKVIQVDSYQTIAAIQSDHPIEPMSAFKAQVAALFYLLADPLEWDSSARTIGLMLEKSDNRATTDVLWNIQNILRRRFPDASVLEVLTAFARFNGMPSTFFHRWGMRGNHGRELDPYGEVQQCGIGKGIYPCRKRGTADDLAEFYSRLGSGELFLPRRYEITADSPALHERRMEKMRQMLQGKKYSEFFIKSRIIGKGGAHARTRSFPRSIRTLAGLVQIRDKYYAIALSVTGDGEFKRIDSIAKTITRMIERELAYITLWNP